ncbi:MAG TPA: hypothetical protein DCQ28_15050 [Bacteroidetes bacterium]|nr:hypothetical protein [Bacteroidota bacterium]
MYSIRWNHSLFFIFLFVIYSKNILFANSLTGTIFGRIVSTEGENLYGAHVVISSLNRGALTDDSGFFFITKVPFGIHRIIASYVGFEPETRIVEVREGEPVQMLFYLKGTSFQIDPVIVTGKPYASNVLDTPQDVSSLSGREKQKSESISLGNLVASLPGLSNISTGAVAGKPVIRGQTGERVLILSDGISQEYQQYGERHSPTIDAFGYERIEVIKGAASLLYGSDALGGVVNLLHHPYHFANDNEYAVDGSFTGGYFSNSNAYTTGLMFNGSSEMIAFRTSIVRKKSDNFHTPDTDPYSVTLQRNDPKFTGEIPNTNFEQLNGSFGVGMGTSLGIFSVDYDHFFNKNNFLLPDGNPIGVRLENQIFNAKGNIPLGKFIVKPKFSIQRNERLATRGGLTYPMLPDSAAVDLVLNVYTMRTEIENVDVFGLSGTVGGEIKYYDHENVGIVPLQPTGNFTNYALFVFEEWKKNSFTVSFGTRFDFRDQIFFGTTTNPLLLKDDHRNYSNLSGSVGTAYQLTDQFTITGNISRGFRTPSFFNLFVYGEHGGVFSFQIGEPNLKNETSLELSTSLRFKNERVNGNVNLFQNAISNYIFLYSAPQHPFAPVGKPYIVAHDQADAAVRGVEVSVDIFLIQWLEVSSSYSYIIGEFTSGPHMNNELPLMPPHKGLFGVKVILPDISNISSPYLSFNSKFVAGKNAAGFYEPFAQFDDGFGFNIPSGVCSTEDYAVIDFGIGFDVKNGRDPVTFDFLITNLTNEIYRDFLDTYKGYALAPGRSYNVRVTIPLNN